MNGEQAQGVVKALVWGAQKARSNLTETMGDSEAAQALLADLEPFLFGESNLLPQLLKWQARIKASGVLLGSDLYNFFTIIDMKARAVLMCCAANGYELPEAADVTWLGQMWEV